MKLLLTSAGISNETLVKTLSELVNKPFSEASLVYIPTAANMMPGGKSWLVTDLTNLHKLGFKEFDILDIAAVPQENWQPRLESADIIVVGGGQPFYLLHWVKKSGLEELLPQLLKDKVYVGISSGSMIMTKKLAYEVKERIFEEKIDRDVYKNDALGYIDFQICPHYKSKDFAMNTEENVSKLAKDINETIYAIDDNTAIKIDNDDIEIVSEGFWKKFN